MRLVSEYYRQGPLHMYFQYPIHYATLANELMRTLMRCFRILKGIRQGQMMNVGGDPADKNDYVIVGRKEGWTGYTSLSVSLSLRLPLHH